MRAIRTETHKLILDFSDRDRLYFPADVEASASGRALRATDPPSPAKVALYDLRVDPHERRNVWEDPEQRATGRALRARLERWMRDTRDPLLAEEAT
jgi:N-sulfoglucosamine sulfohydrolase